MYMVGDRARIRAEVHEPIARASTGYIKSNNIDVVSACIPGIGRARSFDLGSPFDSGDEANARCSCAIGLYYDRGGIGTWQDKYNAAWCHDVGGFLDGGKGMIQRAVIGVTPTGR